MTKLIAIISSNIRDWEIIYRIHATQRMYKRNIEEEEIFFVFDNGQIIERYEEDFPFPSVLINGQSSNKRPLHIVVGIDVKEKRLYFISTYESGSQKWADNFSRRLL